MNGKPERNEQKAGKKEIGGTIGDNTCIHGWTEESVIRISIEDDV